MEISVNQTEEHAHFSLKGTIDEEAAQTLKTKFNSLNKSILKEVVFDFSQVDHIGSAGIGKLLLFYKMFQFIICCCFCNMKSHFGNFYLLDLILCNF